MLRVGWEEPVEQMGLDATIFGEELVQKGMRRCMRAEGKFQIWQLKQHQRLKGITVYSLCCDIQDDITARCIQMSQHSVRVSVRVS